MSKTNAIRILEKLGIPHCFAFYKYNEAEIDAISVGVKINQNLDIIFTTLVATGDKTGINFFVIPGNRELNFKKSS